MDLIAKIIELEIDEEKRKELINIAKNYEKKSGFFDGLFGLLMIAIIALAGYGAGKFHQTSASIGLTNKEITISTTSWWGLFSDDRTFRASDEKFILQE